MFNSAVFVITRVGQLIVSPLATIFLIRYFSVEEYGKYSQIVFLITLLNSIKDFGFSNYLMSKLTKAKERTSQRFNQATVLLQNIVGAFMLVFCVIFSYAFNYDSYIAVVASWIFFSTTYNIVLVNSLRIRSNYTRLSAIAIYQILINILVVIVTIYLERGVLFYCLISYGTNFALSFLLWKKEEKFIYKKKLKNKFSSRFLFYFFKKVKGYSNSHIYYSLYQYSGGFAVSMILNQINLALFAVCIRLFTLSVQPNAVIVNNIIIPKMFKKAINNINMHNNQDFNKYEIYIYALNLMVFIIIYMFGSYVVPMLLGGKYNSVMEYFKIIILGIPLRAISSQIGSKLIISGQVGIKAVSEKQIILFTIPLVAFFTYIYGLTGAIIAFVLSESLLIISYTINAKIKRIEHLVFSKFTYLFIMITSVIIAIMFMVTVYGL